MAESKDNNSYQDPSVEGLAPKNPRIATAIIDGSTFANRAVRFVDVDGWAMLRRHRCQVGSIVISFPEGATVVVH